MLARRPARRPPRHRPATLPSVSVLFWTLLTIVNYAAVAAAIVFILRSRKEPAAMMAWILTLLLLPVLGLILFLLIGDSRITRQVRRRRHRRASIAQSLARRIAGMESWHARVEARRMVRRLRDLVRIASAVGHLPPTLGNKVTIYQDPERVFLALSLAMEAARKHIHVEYYIFQPDDTGRAIRDLLIRKAREGVKVRVLLDAVGSWSLTREFIDAFRQGGVELSFFLPVHFSPTLFRLNCRNHRKLVVVDGTVGFTGSKNIGDEYLGRRKKLGPWRDTNLRIEGPAALHLQDTFIEDWHFVAGQDLSHDDSLFPKPPDDGPAAVQIVPSGPDHERDSLHILLLSAMGTARRSIDIITPYFVPDAGMALAMKAAAMRGVKVRLLVPVRSDSWFVLWAGRSYYREMIDAGIQIFEYLDGMLHSKVVIVDQSWSLVGSANMDVRSFRLNFEVTALLYNEELSQELSAEFITLSERARRFTVEDAEKWNFGESLALGLTRLASPLL